MPRERVSIQQIQQLVDLCKQEGFDLRVPDWNARRPFVVLQYIAYEPTAQPRIMRFKSLKEAKETLEKMWRDAVAFRIAEEERWKKQAGPIGPGW